LQNTVPTMTSDGSASIAIDNMLETQSPPVEPKPIADTVKSGDTARQTDLRLLLDKLKQIRSELDE
jgi:hypothetical protein